MVELRKKLSDGISPADYGAFCAFLEQYSGIQLGDSKEYLVANRLQPIMDAHGFDSLSRLLAYARSDAAGRQGVIDAMTTNETFWFRDKFPFNILKHHILPDLHSRQTVVSIWSAACSSGQETYSIVMTMDEFQQQNSCAGIALKLIATDISEKMLGIAKNGIYDSLSLARGLSSQRLSQYFLPVDKHCSQLKLAIRREVQFLQYSLLEEDYALGQFDVIFCRNVLIYFSGECKLQVLYKMAKVLKPGGYLFLGASEALPSPISEYFDMINFEPGIAYRRK